MDFETIQRLRRSLVLSNLSFSEAAVALLKENVEALDQKVGSQERMYAAQLQQYWQIINATLAAVQHNGNVYSAWSNARFAIRESRRDDSQFEEMMSLTPALMEMFRTPYQGDHTIHERLREWWVAVGQHDEILEIYKSFLAANPLAEHMTPDHIRPLLREWLATRYSVLCEIGNMARALQREVKKGGPFPQIQLAIMVSTLSEDAKTEMERVPDLKRFIMLGTDPAYKTTLAVFTRLPY